MKKTVVLLICLLAISCHLGKGSGKESATAKPPVLKVGITSSLDGKWFPATLKDSLEATMQHKLQFVYFDGVKRLLESEDSLDLAFGVDKSFLRQAITSKKFIKYKSNAYNKIKKDINFNKTYHFTPIFYDFVCILVDTSQIKKVPLTLGEFQEDIYNNQLVLTNPSDFAYSRMFYVKTLARFTQNGHRQFWSSIKNKIRAVAANPAYGLRMIKAKEAAFWIGGVSYEVHYPSLQPILLSDLSIRDVFGVGIYKKSGKIEIAKSFIDLLLEETNQKIFTEQLAVYPIIKGVEQNSKLPKEDFVDESKDAIKSGYIDWRSKLYLDKHHDLFEDFIKESSDE